MLCIFAIMKRNHFKLYMFGVVGETRTHDYFEVISFYNSKDIYHSPICHSPYTTSCVICISKKLEYLKNEARE